MINDPRNRVSEATTIYCNLKQRNTQRNRIVNQQTRATLQGLTLDYEFSICYERSRFGNVVSGLCLVRRPRAFINGYALIITAVTNNWRYAVNAIHVQIEWSAVRADFTSGLTKILTMSKTRTCLFSDCLRNKIIRLVAKTHGSGTRATITFFQAR